MNNFDAFNSFQTEDFDFQSCLNSINNQGFDYIVSNNTIEFQRCFDYFTHLNDIANLFVNGFAQAENQDNTSGTKSTSKSTNRFTDHFAWMDEFDYLDCFDVISKEVSHIKPDDINSKFQQCFNYLADLNQMFGDEFENIDQNIVDFLIELDDQMYLSIKGFDYNNIIKLLSYHTQYNVPLDILRDVLSYNDDMQDILHDLDTILVKSAFITKFEDILKSQSIEVVDRVSNGLVNMLLDWQFKGVIDFINTVKLDANSLDSFTKAVEVIFKYNIHQDSLNKKGQSVKDIFARYNADDWYIELIRLGIDIGDEYKSDKSKQKLLEELTELNLNNMEVKEILFNNYISSTLDEIKSFYYKDSTLSPIGKPVKEWQEDDINKWSKVVKLHNVSDHLSEIIAVIQRATELNYGFSARDTQIIAVLMLYKSNDGKLLEVTTGEGKSIIVAMFAVLKVLEGKKVDIVTSSGELAIRDAVNQARFFNTFGMTIGENVSESGEAPKECYKKDIVYGTTLHFIGDILRDNMASKHIRHNRPLDVVIVDEADNAFIDNSSEVAMLSHSMPGFEFLEPILLTIWSYLQFLRQTIKCEDNQCTYTVKVVDPKNPEILETKTYVIDDVFEFTRSQLLIMAEGTIDRSIDKHELLLIPPHLKKFAKSQVKNWVDSAIHASRMREKVDYDIIIDEDGNSRIAPIDFKSTGVVKKDSSWSDGLHQFIQIKHGLKITKETLTTSFMSNIGYFKEYGKNIYGLTGTLGKQDEQSLLHDVYGVNFGVVPTYKVKKLIEMPTITAESENLWWDAILTSVVKEAASNGRAVLVIFETILQADTFEQKLKQHYDANKIKRYTRDNSERDSVTGVIQSGDIIIATNIAGRGTDIKISQVVEENGGLHVCLTYLPDNLRIQQQAYGRSARSGDSGTAQMVLDTSREMNDLRSTYPWYNKNYITINDLLTWRDLSESERLLENQHYRMKTASLNDELFNKFIELINYLKAQTNYNEDNYNGRLTKYELEQIEESWGIWLKGVQDDMQYHIDEKINDEVKATYKAKYEEIREKILKEFAAFRKLIIDEFNANNLMKNACYLTKKGAITRSIPPLVRALKIDEEHWFAFGANYVRAYIILGTISSFNVEEDGHAINHAIQSAYHDLDYAKQKMNITASMLEGTIDLININNVEKNENELTKQIINKIAIFKKNMEYIDKVTAKLKSRRGEELVAIGSKVDVKTAMNDDEKLADEIEEYYNTGIWFFFEVNLYEPEKDDDFFGTIFSFVAGVVQIVAGVALSLTGGPFALSFGVSMVFEGISDIYNSVKSLIDGIPIKLEDYFTQKGISYAINIIVAGATSAYTSLTTKTAQIGAKEVAKEAGEKITLKAAIEGGKKEVIHQAFKDEFIKQGVIRGITHTANVVLGKIVDEQKDDIEERVERKIRELLNTFKKELQKIFVTDKRNYSIDKQKELRDEALEILKKYEKQFNDVASQIIKGSLGRVENPYVSLGSKFIDMSIGVSRVLDLTDHFLSEFSSKIARKAASIPSDDDHMQERLSIVDFSTQDSLNIVSSMNRAGIFNNHNLVSGQCNDIRTDKYSQFFTAYNDDQKSNIVRVCKNIEEMVSKKYDQETEVLHNSLINFITSSIVKMVKREIVGPMSSFIGVASHDKVMETMQSIKNKVLGVKPANDNKEPKPERQTKLPKEPNGQEPQDPTKPKDTKSESEYAKQQRALFKAVIFKNHPEFLSDEDRAHIKAHNERFGLKYEFPWAKDGVNDNSNSYYTRNDQPLITPSPPKVKPPLKETNTPIKEVYGPYESFDSEYQFRAKQIDEMNGSAHDKQKAKEELYRSMQSVSRMHPIDQEQLANDPVRLRNQYPLLYGFSEYAELDWPDIKIGDPANDVRLPQSKVGETFDRWGNSIKQTKQDASNTLYYMQEAVRKNYPNSYYLTSVLFGTGKIGIRESFGMIGGLTKATVNGWNRIILGDDGPKYIQEASYTVGEHVSIATTEIDKWLGWTAGQKEFAKTMWQGVEIVGALGGAKAGLDALKYGEVFGARHLQKQIFEEKIGTSAFNDRLKDINYVGKAFELPPYGYKNNVLLLKTNDKAPDFVRLFNDAPGDMKSYINGGFVMLRKDLNSDIKSGLSLSGIAQKYGLPNTPAKVVDVKLPTDIGMAVGKAGPIKFGDSILRGGGRQYQILQYPKDIWFPEESVRNFNDYIKDIKTPK